MRKTIKLGLINIHLNLGQKSIVGEPSFLQYSDFWNICLLVCIRSTSIIFKRVVDPAYLTWIPLTYLFMQTKYSKRVMAVEKYGIISIRFYQIWQWSLQEK